MKRVALIGLVLFFSLYLPFSAIAADKHAIEKGVSAVVAAGTFDDATCKANAPESLYIFVMEEGGKLIVHPKKDAIVSLNAPKFQVIYDQVIKATPEGTWVQYQWDGKEKNTFVQKSGDKIVGCGY
jgi:signal transduction histidine kinase